MSPDPFSSQIELAHRRMEALRARVGESGEQAPLLLEAIEELSTTLEELHVANEELRQQNDELAAGSLSKRNGPGIRRCSSLPRTATW